VNKRPNALHYELLVKRLLQTKLAHEPGHTPQIFHRKVYRGASGQDYEIDVSFETFIADARVLTLIECKCYKDKVGVDDVAEFAYKVRDIGAHKGIIVTTVGFESGAITVAVREGLGLVIAIKAWLMRVPCLGSFPAPYVIHDKDHASFRYPKVRGFVPYASPPFLKYSSSALAAGPDSNPASISSALIGFQPALDGFSGDPMTLLQAAGVFCVETDISPGLLLKMQGFMEPECI
jgi:hypothetical protein